MLPRVVAVACALLIAPVAFAEEGTGDEEGWSGQGEFGLVVTTGNSETETLNTNLNAAFKADAWVHKGGISALSASEDGDKTAERYQLTGKTEYHTSERSYWFGSLRYEDDKFSGFEYQGILTGGYGRVLLDGETTHLDLEAGVGVRRTKPASTLEMPNPEATSDAVARGAAAYWWQFTENARLQNDFLVESGEDNTFVQNQLGLRLAINSRFSVKLGYEVRHNTEVPEGTEETDTVSTVNLVYAFQ